MNPRLGVAIGAVLAGAVALILAFAPLSWLVSLLDVSGADATTFLVRRYGVSATVGVAVVTAALARRVTPLRAALLALAAWFGVQAAAAAWGLASGTVAGLAVLALIADPLIAAWFLVLYRKTEDEPSEDSLRVRGTPDIG